VVDLGREADLGRLEGVVGREGDGEEENASCIRRVTLDEVGSVLNKYGNASIVPGP
jgi:hypothetical protein